MASPTRIGQLLQGADVVQSAGSIAVFFLQAIALTSLGWELPLGLPTSDYLSRLSSRR